MNTIAARTSSLSFPRAFALHMTFMTGLMTMIWSMILDSVWLAVTGFLITLAGTVWYGFCQSDD